MKRKLIFLAIIAICTFVTSQAQVKIDFNNPPWETGCDSLSSQTQMNVCSAEKSALADSVLRLCYETLINYIDNEYKITMQQVAENPTRIAQGRMEQLKQQKEAIIKSQEYFDAFRRNTVEVVSIQYMGGSMRPMVSNTYKLDLTVNQIKILIDLMAELKY